MPLTGIAIAQNRERWRQSLSERHSQSETGNEGTREVGDWEQGTLKIQELGLKNVYKVVGRQNH